MASTYLSRTGIGSSNNQKKWTFSGWFKKSTHGSELRFLTSSDNSSYDDNIRFNSNDTIEVVYNNFATLKTNRLFRDVSAYYHIVVKVDTDQALANDRAPRVYLQRTHIKALEIIPMELLKPYALDLS